MCLCACAIPLEQAGMEDGGDDEEWEGDEEDAALEDAAAAAAGEEGGKAPPEWAQVPTQEMGGRSADLV